MLDQRGTGRSTPVGDPVGETPQQQADYLKHFRADSIVRDAELVREALGGDKWSVTGQSFGGFCTLSYLSLAPEGLREAFFTGECRRSAATSTTSTARPTSGSSSARAATTSATPRIATACSKSTSGWRTRTSACPPATA